MSKISPVDRSKKRQIRLEPPPKKSRTVRPLAPPPRPTTEAETAPRWQRLATALLFMVLGLVAMAVFAVLPEWVEERRASTSAGIVSTASAPEPVTERAEAEPVIPAPINENPETRQQAEDALFRLTQARRSVEERGVELWGGAEYEEARQQAQQGDTFFKADRFSQAAEAYEKAIERFDRLDDRRPAVLRQALEEGEAALASGDARTATRAFELAQAINPGNARAERGLARAAVADDVARLMAQASDRENGADFGTAARLYREALNLDPATSAARQALARLDSRRAAEAFSQVMGEGLTALEREAFEEAREAFVRASELRPGSQESADGLARAEAGLRRTKIEDFQRRAGELEGKEEWRQAAEAYHEVLKIDPTVAFAQAGLRRATQRADLVEKIEGHLASPERLAAQEVLNEASALYNEGQDLDGTGPRMRRQLDRLAGLLGEYSKPVEARLLSDELTDVTIYKVGHLGTFSSHALELRPGTYTVVGVRKGYRDVRRQLVIRPGIPPEPLTIRCEEKI